MCIYPVYVWMKIVDNAVAASETATPCDPDQAQSLHPTADDRPPRLTPKQTTSMTLGNSPQVEFTIAFRECKDAVAWSTSAEGLAWKQASSLQCLIYVSPDLPTF